MLFKKNVKSQIDTSSTSTENSLREATARGMGREIEQRDIARALARDARYVRARKACSAS